MDEISEMMDDNSERMDDKQGRKSRKGGPPPSSSSPSLPLPLSSFVGCPSRGSRTPPASSLLRHRTRLLPPHLPLHFSSHHSHHGPHHSHHLIGTAQISPLEPQISLTQLAPSLHRPCIPPQTSPSGALFFVRIPRLCTSRTQFRRAGTQVRPRSTSLTVS
jgi:hypothetical protein